MKKPLLILFAAMCMVVAAAGSAQAGWGKCGGCHFGMFAPSKATMKEKFKTLDAFVNGALASESSMMEHVKKNPGDICAIAKEIGYKEPEKQEADSPCNGKPKTQDTKTSPKQ